MVRRSSGVEMKDELQPVLERLSPSAREHLRRVLIQDHADRDGFASRLMRYRDRRSLVHCGGEGDTSHGMAIGGPGGHIPSPGIAGFFKGRIPRTRASVIVERNDGGTWHEVGRYATPIDAKLAVDQAIATGSQPTSLRVAEGQTSGRLLLIVGGLAVAVAVGIVLYLIFSSLGATPRV
jgi:hypothetical protein